MQTGRLLARRSLIMLLPVLAGLVAASSAAAAQVQINNGYGRCLDARLQTLATNGGTVQLWTCLPGAPINQEWYVDAVPGTSAVRIRSADGGRCLQPAGTGDGAKVLLYNCAAGARSQEWSLGPTHIVNVATGRYLDAQVQEIQQDGTPVQIWHANGSPQQNWFTTPISGALTASPAEVGLTADQPGSTTISWSAPGAGAHVWESVNGGAPALFAAGVSGSKLATIPPGTSVFTLTYGTDPSEHLAALTVTAIAAAGSAAAAAGPCAGAAAGAATQLTASISPHSRANPLAATVGFGRQTAVTGTLTNAQGAGVAGAEVCLVGQNAVAGAPMQFESSAVTGAAGQFALVVPSGPSRTLWAVASGAVSLLETTLQESVRTRITIHANHGHLLNGRVLKLHGTVPGPIPRRGVLALVQVWRGSYWETFEDTHTGPRGGYTARYRFKFTTLPTAYRMRTLVPAQSSYPYLSAHSRSVIIHVRP